MRTPAYTKQFQRDVKRVQRAGNKDMEKLKRVVRALIDEKPLDKCDLYSIERITDDPSDNIFLACAMEAEADYIGSRDPHLRDLKQFRRIEIIDVKTFVGKVKRG